MKRNGRTHALAEVMESILPQLDSDRKGQMLLPRLWKQAVGEVFARQSCPSSIVRGVLQVTVSNSNWLQELHFMKAEIMERLGAVLPGTTISDIRFRVGHVPSATDPASDEPLPPLSASEQRSISAQADCIQDEELRRALEAVITAHARNRKSKS
jgi:hypothetical protein